MERLMSFFSGAPQYPHKNRAMAYRSEKLEINEVWNNEEETSDYFNNNRRKEKNLYFILFYFSSQTHSNNNEETGFLMHFFQHEKSLLTQWLSQSLQNQNVPASLPFVTPSPKQKIIFDTGTCKYTIHLYVISVLLQLSIYASDEDFHRYWNRCR